MITHTKQNTSTVLRKYSTLLKLILKGKHISCLGFQIKFFENLWNLNTDNI